MRRRIAATVASGKTVASAAREAGVSRQTASAVVNSPEGQFLITTLVEAEAKKIRKIFAGALNVIAAAMEAQRYGIDPDGDLVDFGPDHYARLTAVKCLTALLTAGRQAMKPPEPPRRSITMDEALALLREHDPKALQ